MFPVHPTPIIIKLSGIVKNNCGLYLYLLLQTAFAYLDNPYLLRIIPHRNLLIRIPLATESAEDAGVRGWGVHVLKALS